MASPDWLLEYLRKEGRCPLGEVDQLTRDRVRAMLRWGGFKPSGRSKPACEFLERAHAQGGLTSINLAVDLCNAVSLHSGFPISVVDLDLCQLPLFLQVVKVKSSYVFNPSGQELDLEGLLCLCDAQGPCGSAVKDSQRTKTHAQTRRTLSLIWAESSLANQAQAALAWYREISQRADVEVS